LRKTDRVYTAAAFFAGFFCLVYFLAGQFYFGLPRYFPLEHVWKINASPDLPSIGFYSRFAFSFIFSSLVSGLIFFVLARKSGEQNLSSFWIKLAGGLSYLVIFSIMLCILVLEYKHWGVF